MTSLLPSFHAISKHGVIGNLRTLALVSMDGTLDYLPFTRFDSSTLFAALLDTEKGGQFSLSPNQTCTENRQLYLPDTAVLITRFQSEQGIAELIDFMPILADGPSCAVVRMLKMIRGQLDFTLSFAPRFNYARDLPEFKKIEGGWSIHSSSQQQEQCRLLSSLALSPQQDRLEACFTLSEGDDNACFVIETTEKDQLTLAEYMGPFFEQTVKFWKNWSSSSTYTGYRHETVTRSAITLKLLTAQQYGATIAAGTFGLPEALGGVRNWDYRYVWIRDAAFTMYAFLRLGFMQEAQAFIQWIIKRCQELEHPGQLQLMYSVDGGQDLSEYNLEHLSGYQDSLPVRVGNAAAQQFQLDIYGELLDTVYLFNQHGGPITYDFWQNLERFIDFVAEHWQDPDHGIWEVRDQKQEFLYSKVMAWVALDRGILIAEDRSFPTPLDEWREVRNAIYKDVYFNYWSEEKQAFVQFRGSNTLDSAALIMPLVRFLSPYEPRWVKTLAAIEAELVSDCLVYRYRLDQGSSDGLVGEEGTFTLCSFWYIENLAKSGQVEKAQLLFEKMLGYANHLGLFSEQIALNGDQLGNFPQAFTHLGLISAAWQLNQLLNHESKLLKS